MAQIKENNSTKQSINDLVSMQEKMNELLKDTINIDSIDKLDEAKKDFTNHEVSFEKMREGFTQQDKNDLIDLLISDIHKSHLQIIKNNP